MRALHTAATGMMAQELNVQVISNNIANMRTTGYKRQRAEFQDLLYEHVSRVGTQTSTQGNILPVGIELGGGVKTVGTPRVMTQGTLLADRQADSTSPSAAKASSRSRCRTAPSPIRATARSRWTRRAASSPRRATCVQPGITIPQNATSITINPQGQVSATCRARPRRRCSASSSSPASSTRPACRRSATTCSSRRRPPARRRTAARHRRLRRPAAGQPRAGQRRGGHRNLRPDRRAARLRDERQGHHRRRPDAAGDLQPDALRSSHDPRIASLSLMLRRARRSRLSPRLAAAPRTRSRGSRTQAVVAATSCASATSSRTPASAADVPIFRAPDLGQTGARAGARASPRRCGRTASSGSTPRGIERSRGDAREPRHRAPKDIEARIVARARRRNTASATRQNLTISFDREVRTLHVEPATRRARASRA